MRALLTASLILAVALPVAGADMARDGGTPNAAEDTSCGNAFYDEGVSASAGWFGGGQAGNPDAMMGVLFSLTDFGFAPGATEIISFCAGNDIDYGGPWPNEVFVYHDDNGLPDDSTVLGQGTIYTGDGAGQVVVPLGAPALLNGDFWLLARGDAMWAGEDFNLEFDDGPATGHSFISSSGIADLAEPQYTSYPDGVNYILRATIQEVGVPTPTPPVGGGDPVPALSTWSIVVFLMVLAGIAVLLIQRRG